MRGRVAKKRYYGTSLATTLFHQFNFWVCKISLRTLVCAQKNSPFFCLPPVEVSPAIRIAKSIRLTQIAAMTLNITTNKHVATIHPTPSTTIVRAVNKCSTVAGGSGGKPVVA